MIALDTTAIIDLFRGDTGIKKILEQSTSIVTTRINYLEIHFGLNIYNSIHTKEIDYYNEFFNSVRVLELNAESCQRASALRWVLKNKGQTINDFDLVIVGILQAHGINQLVTKNTKHFKSIKDIKVITY